jgi:hypothetical protein
MAAVRRDAVAAYSPVPRHLREARCPLSSQETSPVDVQRPIDDGGQVILSALDETQFASVGGVISLPAATV